MTTLAQQLAANAQAARAAAESAAQASSAEAIEQLARDNQVFSDFLAFARDKFTQMVNDGATVQQLAIPVGLSYRKAYGDGADEARRTARHHHILVMFKRYPPHRYSRSDHGGRIFVVPAPLQETWNQFATWVLTEGLSAGWTVSEGDNLHPEALTLRLTNG